MKIYQRLSEVRRNGYIVTVHVSDDCKPEILQALGEMMEHVVMLVEKGGLTKCAADECLCSSDKKHSWKDYTMGHVVLCEWCGTRR